MSGSPLVVRVIRPADQLDLLLELNDVTLDSSANELNAVPGGDPRMRVVFGAQHAAEDAFADVIVSPPATEPVIGRTAGMSRLVTSLPTPLPFTVEALLHTATWELRSPTHTGKPGDDETALEIPTGLIVAPAGSTGLTTTGFPRTEGDVTELWRLQLVSDGSTPLEVIAVHNVGFGDSVSNPVPDHDTRDDLIANTTTIGPAQAGRLELSSQGAFARFSGRWPGAQTERWRHTVLAGRDIVAEVVQEGFLLPFGHQVKILDVNSRRLVPDQTGQAIAVLQHELFLCVDAPNVTFDSADPDLVDPGMAYRPHGGRGFPFASIDAVSTEWIPIELIEVTDDDGPIPGAFDVIVKDDGTQLVVSFDATDRAGGSQISFGLGATIIDKEHAFDTAPGATLQRVTALLSAAGSESRRTFDLKGQSVAFADELAVGLGKTTFSTNQVQLTFTGADGASTTDLEDAFRLGLFPEVEWATIIDDAISAAVGDEFAELLVTLHHRWIEFGLDATNFDQAFLKLDVAVEKALGGAARAVAAIDLVAEVFNQTVGVGLDLVDITQEFSAEDALGTASSLLGFIPLDRIMPPISFGDALPGVDVPGLDVSFDESGFKAVFTFTPKIQSFPDLGFEVRGNDPRAFIENVSCVPIDGEPDNTLTIRLDDVTVTIPPFAAMVELDFSRVEVIESTSDGLRVDPRLEDWRWGSLLTWLQPLTNLLDKLGDGLINITPLALEIATDIPLPAIDLGVVSISNAAIFAGIDLPFTAGFVPDVSLGLGSAAQPVEISVLGYGAEFYIEVEISPGNGGLRRLTASVELEAMLYGIDIVVASADITLRISALFKLRDGDITFIGSVGIEGNISVLGLLDVSVGIVASARYRSANEDLKLSGRITYSVDTFLGGASGSIPIGDVTFDLAGDGGAENGSRSAFAALTSSSTTTAGPPSFRDRFTTTEWADEYTAAFA